MTHQKDNRDVARRKHRSFALFCALKYRHFDWDGVLVTRAEMTQVLELDHFKQERIDWIQEDFAQYFRYQFLTGMDSSFSQIVLSFRAHSTAILIGRLSLGKDPTELDVKERLQSCLSPFARSHLNGSELAISATLTMLAQGQIGLKDLFGTRAGELYKKCDCLLRVLPK